MFTYNGIVYGGSPKDMLEVSSVRILDDKIMILTFSTGEERLFDATVLKGKAFEPLDDDAVFKSAVVDHGIVTWMNGEIDCAPEYMYENSYAYVSPDSPVQEAALKLG